MKREITARVSKYVDVYTLLGIIEDSIPYETDLLPITDTAYYRIEIKVKQIKLSKPNNTQHINEEVFKRLTAEKADNIYQEREGYINFAMDVLEDYQHYVREQNEL